MIRRLLVALALVLPAAVRAAVPAADFFENPAFTGGLLSPSGRYLAAKVGSPSGRDRLAVWDLATLKGQPVAELVDADINHYQWVNDNRLLFDSTDKDLAPGEMDRAPGLFAVDRDGTNFRQLAQRTANFVTTPTTARILPWHTYMLDQPGAQDSDSVYVQSVNFEPGGSVRSIDLIRLDTKTGRTGSARRPGDVHHWLLDAKGEPRLAVTLEQGKETVWLRENDAWRALTTFDAWVTRAGGFGPLDISPDGQLYVVARKDSDKSAVHVFDTKTNTMNPTPLVKLEDYDFSGRLIRTNGKLVGVRYLTDAQGTVWLDEEMKALQEKVDNKLRGTVNVIELPRRPETPFVLVTAYADVQPAVHFVYDRAKDQYHALGEAHPRIKAAQMGRQEMVRYTARDGLVIPGLLTLPHGAKRGDKLPMVVLVHGGPWVRGAVWGWAPDSQFLASRGYAVLEPEFRGSTGYGSRLFRAGLKQWGLAMQDDIADATRWAIGEGIADPKRICIAGASYGGYATLMGLIRDPDLYRCGFEWAGVTDIKLMFGSSWFHTSDLPAQYIKYGMPQLIGDLEKDAAQLSATSPVEQAARLNRPLLMAYGSADRRVPRAHGVRFRDAVAATNKNVEWIEYPDEGHGWKLPKNRVDFWTRVEQFLDRNIGAAAAAAP